MSTKPGGRHVCTHDSAGDGARLRRFSAALVRWYAGARRDFPWRRSPDPYILLVAEVLLKQTTADQAASCLPGLLKAYPSPERLARARVPRLERILQPLGLSRQRASQLKALGAALQALKGRIEPDELELLPGVGSYTASAVRCFAFGLPVGVVDTNVTRVLSRAFSIAGSRYEARKSPEFWALADALVGTRPRRARELNWAILDLADGICSPRKPHCASCPVRDCCDYGRSAIREG